MIAVIFEVWPHADTKSNYFVLAAALSNELKSIDGFISVERFESVTAPGKFLSLSFWRDEHALTQWRNRTAHRAAQAQGRAHVFEDYRLRVASVVRDYGLHVRAEAPPDSQTHHAA